MSSITGEQVATGEQGSALTPASDGVRSAPLGPTLTLTMALAAAAFLVAMAVILSVLHPPPGHLSALYIRQNQSGKTVLYVGAFVVLLPLALLAGPRIADRIFAGQNGPALLPLADGLAAGLALALVLVRILPFSGRGLHSVLIAAVLWWILALALLVRAARPERWPPLLWLVRAGPALGAIAAAAVFGALLCLTSLSALSALAIVLGAIAALVIVVAWGRVSLPSAPRFSGLTVDLIVSALLLLAVTNVVVYHASSALPNGITPPGVIQFQQDWILGPTNQLLSGGALLVGDPVSQYGVGLVYFLAGVFHVAPIGYGTFGLLDGILTSLVYIGGYLVLRLAGLRRPLAIGALGLAVVVFIYHLQYPVGSLPEEGPLRFGLPMAVILGVLLTHTRPRLASTGRAVALAAVGVSAVWAVEAFAYTTFTYLILILVEGYLRPAAGRRRWILTALALGLGAGLAAHVILALATLAATGYWPDWSQYLVYVHGLLLGGREGAVTYGFADWSPGLAVGAACLASAATLALLMIRAPLRVRAHPGLTLALAGCTAYAIAAFSYTDNRSNTYLFPYVSLPVLLAVVLWLGWLLGTTELSLGRRRAGLAGALAVGVLMVAAAWPTIGGHFSESALARAYPSGGLSSALHRLWHPPPIDPRAPVVEALLARYVRGRHVLVVLPDAPDLTIEALMRSSRALALYVGDPAQDFWNPSLWIPRIRRQLAHLRPGTRVLVDSIGLGMARQLRGHPDSYSLNHPVSGGNPELEWIIHRMDQLYRIVPVHRGPGQFVVARLLPRAQAG